MTEMQATHGGKPQGSDNHGQLVLNGLGQLHQLMEEAADHANTKIVSPKAEAIAASVVVCLSPGSVLVISFRT